MKLSAVVAWATIGLMAACAGPALNIYTLSLPASSGPEPPIGGKPTVIAVSRMTLQNDVDGTDLMLRDGSTLRRSLTGRWASRLSVAMTNRLTERLAARYPRALVTSSPLTDTAALSIRINVSRLDINTDGSAVMDADWLVVPANTRLPVRQERSRLALQGSVATDPDIVALTGALVDRLASDIDVGAVR
ncbi:MAG: membrane integrity-associated transporter subunit PqiC [Rhodopila sp.]